MKKYPLAIVWDEWKKRNLDGKPDSYLENRLRAAFNAGAKAGELLAYDTVALGIAEARKLTERERR